MFYRTLCSTHDDRIDKPGCWRDRYFWSLWIGLGPYSLSFHFE